MAKLEAANARRLKANQKRAEFLARVAAGDPEAVAESIAAWQREHREFLRRRELAAMRAGAGGFEVRPVDEPGLVRTAHRGRPERRPAAIGASRSAAKATSKGGDGLDDADAAGWACRSRPAELDERDAPRSPFQRAHRAALHLTGRELVVLADICQRRAALLGRWAA